MLKNIQKTKAYMQPANGIHGDKASLQKPEYDLETYKNMTHSVGQLQSEMMLRPTVSPKELNEVRKHTTI